MKTKVAPGQVDIDGQMTVDEVIALAVAEIGPDEPPATVIRDWRGGLCAFRCMRSPDVLIDGDTALCFDCFEAWFDRLGAIELQPGLRELLPSLTEGGHR